MVLLKQNRLRLELVVAAVLLPLAIVAATGDDSGDPLNKLAALHNNLGVVRALNDDFDQAGLHFDSAFMLVGETAPICNNLGNCHLCRGDVSRAIHWYERASAHDSLDKRILFNWSLALYESGGADEAVSMMQRFLEYYSNADDTTAGVTWLRDEGILKGEAQVTTTAEVKRLMDKARATMKQALERKKVSAEKPESDSLAATTETTPKHPKRTIPAGGKALESASITSLLYWIVIK